MPYFTIGWRLPRVLAVPLFGDRRRFGPVPVPGDPCWEAFLRLGPELYEETQRRSVGAIVNESGYAIMRRVPLDGLRVLEVGPGRISHARYWRGRPAEYHLADVHPEMLTKGIEDLRRIGIEPSVLVQDARAAWKLPFADARLDAIVTFYSLEHLYPLERYLDEFHRVLKPGGAIVGAIPCEGGLAWGLGRWLTTRRWMLENTSINPDKVICWGHPNVAEAVLTMLDRRFERGRIRFWPLAVPLVDLNLTASFVYRKPAL